MAVRKVATLHNLPGSRTWVETLHDDMEAAEKEAVRLLEAGEAGLVRFEHRIYPSVGKKGILRNLYTTTGVVSPPAATPAAASADSTPGAAGGTPEA